MKKYFCHECAISNSLVTPVNPAILTETEYQLCKIIKHTAPLKSYQLNSVFDDPTIKVYREYMVNTSASGYLEIDDLGRKNLIWFAGSRAGAEYRNDVFVAPDDGIKLVCPENEAKAHAFPIAGSPHLCITCASCGKALPLW